MTPTLEEALRKEHPMLAGCRRPFEVEDGWAFLVDKACRQLIGPRFPSPLQVTCVKEKWGRLSIYVNGQDWTEEDFRQITKVLDGIENESVCVCEFCGSLDNVTQTKKGWIKTLCQECRGDK